MRKIHHPREILDRLATVNDLFIEGKVGDAGVELGHLIEDVTRYVEPDPGKISNIHKGRPLVLVDFDGVVHSYKSGWKGVDVIPDEPNVGAISWLTQLMDEFEVRIFSARCNDTAGIRAMKRWFLSHGMHPDYLSQLGFEAGKPSAFIVIDDRCLQFDGNFWRASAEAIKKFKPWYYGHAEWKRK